jgi:uncharacterized phiE125 gp8 family phage protein
VAHSDDDEYIGSLISAAREHVEKYCGATFAQSVAEVYCDEWSDLVWLPVWPIETIDSIEYVDVDGVAMTLPTSVYEYRADARTIVLKAEQSWPSKQYDSRILITVSLGADVVPAAVKHAILLRVEDFYENRGSEGDSDWTAFDSLLSNHRHY